MDHDYVFESARSHFALGYCSGLRAEREGAVVVERLVVCLGVDLGILRPVRRYDNRDAHLSIRHDIAVDGVVGVIGERIGLGEDGFPTIGHSVTVGIPDERIGSVAVLLFFVSKTVAIRIFIRRQAGGRGTRPVLHIFEAVGDVVLVDVGVFHDKQRLREGRSRLGDLDRDRRPDIRHAIGDAVRVAPRFIRVALAVAVCVDKGHHVVAAGSDAVEYDIRGDRREGARKVVRKRGDIACSGETLACYRVAGEVGRLVDAHHDICELVRRRTEVAHFCGEASVARVGVGGVDSRSELGGVAPIEIVKRHAVVLGVDGRDAPVVVRVIQKFLTDVSIGLEDITQLRRRVHQVRVSVHGAAEVRICRELDNECCAGHLGDPLQGGTRRVDRVADITVGACNLGLDTRDKGALERLYRCRVVATDVNLIVCANDGVRINARLESVFDEILPVEVIVAVGDEVRLGEDASACQVDRLRVDHPSDRSVFVDGGSHDADIGFGFVLRGDGEASGRLGRIGELNVELGDLIPTNVDILRIAEGFAFVKVAVAVKVGKRDEGVGAFADVTERIGTRIFRR